jgi:hypothetical protein
MQTAFLVTYVGIFVVVRSSLHSLPLHVLSQSMIPTQLSKSDTGIIQDKPTSPETLIILKRFRRSLAKVSARQYGHSLFIRCVKRLQGKSDKRTMQTQHVDFKEPWVKALRPPIKEAHRAILQSEDIPGSRVEVAED